jgi:CBS-domain-containing membrane protein
MKAAEIMTTRLVTVQPETPVADAVHLMLQDQVSGLPVVDEAGRLVGIVTEGDFLRRAELGTERRRRRWMQFLLGPDRLADEYIHSHARKVSDVMTTEIVSVGADTPLDEVVNLMERHRIKRVPVVRDDKIIGIISRANLLRALGTMTATAKLSTRSIASDTVIRKRIMADMSVQAWAPLPFVSVVVWDGSVHFWGTINDEKQRQALRVLAEGVPGVEEVRDHLVLVDPTPALVP